MKYLLILFLIASPAEAFIVNKDKSMTFSAKEIDTFRANINARDEVIKEQADLILRMDAIIKELKTRKCV